MNWLRFEDDFKFEGFDLSQSPEIPMVGIDVRTKGDLNKAQRLSTDETVPKVGERVHAVVVRKNMIFCYGIIIHPLIAVLPSLANLLMEDTQPV
jgi:hypothetical protein